MFHKNRDGVVFHTYSTYGRGDETWVGAYSFLDLMPFECNENGPNHDLRDWVCHHDH